MSAGARSMPGSQLCGVIHMPWIRRIVSPATPPLIAQRRDPAPPASGPRPGAGSRRRPRRLHDRETEARPVGGAAVRTAEALERVRDERLGKAGAMVRDVQLEPTAATPRVERDLAAAVAERVLDEVAERLLEPKAVGSDDERLDG